MHVLDKRENGHLAYTYQTIHCSKRKTFDSYVYSIQHEIQFLTNGFLFLTDALKRLKYAQIHNCDKLFLASCRCVL